jgi:hypothetical protein
MPNELLVQLHSAHSLVLHDAATAEFSKPMKSDFILILVLSRGSLCRSAHASLSVPSATNMFS